MNSSRRHKRLPVVAAAIGGLVWLTIAVALATAQTAAQTATLAPTDGYDHKQGKTLVQDGKLSSVKTSDNNRVEVESGYFTSFQFARRIPADATVEVVKVGVEHHEEEEISPGSIQWQVGGGSLRNSTTRASFSPALLEGEAREAKVEWNVTQWVDTPAEVNDLKLRVRNGAANGKKTKIDRVYVAVRYSRVPTAPKIASKPVTTAAVGEAYAYQAAAGGTRPITWSLVRRPAGMSVNAATGRVSWRPRAARRSLRVTLRATNSVGRATQSYKVTVSRASPFKELLAAGDIADCSSPGDEQTARLLDTNPRATVATLGDNAYDDGSPSDYANCYQPTWGRAKARTGPSPGNHEYHTSNASGYFGYYGPAAGVPGKGYYSYDLGAWHLISLNSERDFGASGAQLSWLKADLAATGAKCVLAYWHKPRFTMANYSDFTAYGPFWDALYEANADVVLNGHDHVYERYRPLNPAGAGDAARGIREFVVGTGGRHRYTLRPDPRREAQDDDTWGVLKLTLRATSYDWRFLPVAGSTYTDSGRGTCH